MADEKKFIVENIRRLLLKEYLTKETERAGFGGVEIWRTPMGTRVSLLTERPGLVIGRKGEVIKNLTRIIEEEFKYQDPKIDVLEEKSPFLNPHIVAKKVATALERGWHFRKVGHNTVQKIMSAGARGCRVIISGKLLSERHRTEKFVAGNIKFCGDSAFKFMKRGYAQAKLKPGVMGVIVDIMTPDAKLPDEIIIKEMPPEGVEALGKEAEKTVERVPEIVERSVDTSAEIGGVPAEAGGAGAVGVAGVVGRIDEEGGEEIEKVVVAEKSEEAPPPAADSGEIGKGEEQRTVKEKPPFALHVIPGRKITKGRVKMKKLKKIAEELKELGEEGIEIDLKKHSKRRKVEEKKKG